MKRFIPWDRFQGLPGEECPRLTAKSLSLPKQVEESFAGDPRKETMTDIEKQFLENVAEIRRGPGPPLPSAELPRRRKGVFTMVAEQLEEEAREQLRLALRLEALGIVLPHLPAGWVKPHVALLARSCKRCGRFSGCLTGRKKEVAKRGNRYFRSIGSKQV